MRVRVSVGVEVWVLRLGLGLELQIGSPYFFKLLVYYRQLCIGFWLALIVCANVTDRV